MSASRVASRSAGSLSSSLIAPSHPSGSSVRLIRPAHPSGAAIPPGLMPIAWHGQVVGATPIRGNDRWRTGRGATAYDHPLAPRREADVATDAARPAAPVI